MKIIHEIIETVAGIATIGASFAFLFWLAYMVY